MRLSVEMAVMDMDGEISAVAVGEDSSKFHGMLRLNETAEQAKKHGFDYFTTTLSVSPPKNAENVNRAGEEAARRSGVKYLYADFKKKNGYLRSLQLSAEYGLYRQNYCGCLYSRNDG